MVRQMCFVICLIFHRNSNILFVYCLFCLFETGSHYAVQAGLELTFVAQAGLELIRILLPQPPKCWDYRHVPPHPAG